MLRHFGIYPLGFDKENLFEEQKIFLIYLMTQIPELDYWKRNVDYKIKLSKIKSLESVEIPQTEKDLANITGKDLKQLHKEQLFNEKKRRMAELNKEYGIEESEDEIEKTVEIKPDIKDSNPQRLWELLHGKGLVK